MNNRRAFLPYTTWKGRIVQNTQTKEFFIETNPSDWDHRLAMWKRLHRNDQFCPCPMPKGHVMFLNYKKSTNYVPVQEL
jgi:hypothetical protein